MRYKLLYAVFSLLLVLVACSSEDAVVNKENGKMSRVLLNIPTSERLESVKYLFFKDGKLNNTASVSPTGGELKLPLEGAGNLYLVVNEGGKLSFSAGSGMTEEAWQDATIDLDESQKPLNFIIGKVAVKDDVAEYSAVMKRGVARFDVTYAFPGTKVISLTLKGMAGKSYLIEKVPFSVPSDVENIDLKVEGEAITGEDQTGVIYAYEQINPEATVEIEMSDGKVHSAKLPEQILRNKVYTLQIGRDGSLHSITVDEWTKEEDEILAPDRESFITVNEKLSVLNDRATILPDARGVSVSYLSGTFDLALNCGEELEYVNGGNNWVKITPVNPEASSLAERNVFRITKKLVAPNCPLEDMKLQFRRKGLSEVYDEDCLTVVLEQNDDTLEGMLDFNNENYECDFGRYIDGTLGTYTVGEGKTMALEVSESNPWIRLVRSEENRNSYIIQAGWKPNDPEADGREQSAKLIITDRNGNKQEYTIKRRNFGLPVILLNDIWWCKFNAIGNSRDFNDQILCAEDPTRASGQTVLEYLKSCSNEEFLKVWNSAYGGTSGQAMTAVYSNGKFTLDGYNSDESQHINHQDPKSLSPEGYEIPTFDDYKRILGTFAVPTSPAPFNPSNGGADYRSEIFMDKRNEVLIGEQAMSDIRFITISSLKGKGTEPLTLYGVGCQWSGSGINHNWLLFANYNPSTTGWLFKPTNANLEHNGAAANNTRIVRFKKSAVEYIYGVE
ncbi:hypothetical protein WKU26_05620 [Phocaeicola sp. HCN-40430]|uniref:hypothetical protein n=1 Tax=Phocaeicola sp. HCN-40430 TaxID=3134664 RepID=UPI0030C1616D